LPAGTFRGVVDGTDAQIALTLDESDAVAFVRGGPSTLASHTRWLSGDYSDDTPQLSADRGDGWSLAAFVTEQRVTGEVTAPDGTTTTFSAVHSDDPISGLFAGVDAGCRAGVIAADRGDASVDLFGAWCDSEGRIAAIEGRMPHDEFGATFAVSVDTAIGRREFIVEEVVPRNLRAGD
jgi:hypothetical protein